MKIYLRQFGVPETKGVFRAALQKLPACDSFEHGDDWFHHYDVALLGLPYGQMKHPLIDICLNIRQRQIFARECVAREYRRWAEKGEGTLRMVRDVLQASKDFYGDDYSVAPSSYVECAGWGEYSRGYERLVAAADRARDLLAGWLHPYREDRIFWEELNRKDENEWQVIRLIQIIDRIDEFRERSRLATKEWGDKTVAVDFEL